MMPRDAIKALIENGKHRRRHAEALAQLVIDSPHSTPEMVAHAQAVLSIDAASDNPNPSERNTDG